jgi:DNA-binding MarR family transcriptional regulator
VPPATLEAKVRSVLKARRARESLLGHELFSDPAWDILLELYLAELSQHRQTITALCAGAAVPATTALRWINHLEAKGLVRKSPDPIDRQRVFTSLSETASEMMKGYFEGPASNVATA